MNGHINTIIIYITVCLTGAQGWESKLFPDTGGAYSRVSVERNSVTFRLPDFSYAGYRSGMVAVPDIPVAVELTPVAGDNAPQINRAIGKVSRKKPDENGFRGKIMLSEGTFEIHNEIKIYHSGIVVGGNGYLFNPVCSDDHLFRDCSAKNGRHNFILHYSTSGCVFTGCSSQNSRSDFHQYLSSENLFDNVTLHRDSVTAGNRGDKSQGSWWCATKPVFWNMQGGGAMYMNAWGAGYLIGADTAIGIGVGDRHILQDYGLSYLPHRQWIERGDGALQPESLYEAQLNMRKQRLSSGNERK
ncbi:MAG: hypothetical protein GF398_01600 [Chitinivibrionales bacterium]|nr:hypothetical protein [Chitinivibrionales bacterium]